MTSARLLAKHGISGLDSNLRVYEGRRLARRGELTAATREAAAAVDLARAQRNPNMGSVGMLHLGEIHAQCENWPAARSALEESLRIARESGTTLNLEARMLARLARVYLEQGEIARASETALEALAVARKRGARHHEALAQIVVADVLRRLRAARRGGVDRRDGGRALRA